MVTLICVLMILGSVACACVGATKEMRERDQFFKELERIKDRVRRGLPVD
jgi:hypothetical protein